MVAVLGTIIFASGLAVAMAVIVGMIAPQWQRVLRLATGHAENGFAPLAQLAVVERQIAVRRWAAERRSSPVFIPLREAA